jgi:hypothetical protein
VGLAGRVHQSGWDSFDAGGSDADQIEGALLSMLTQGEDVEAHALKERGWAISAIARHLERDRKTVRSYLNGDRQPGDRVTVVVEALAEFQGYVRARFVDDPHLWATSLFDEVVALGYTRSYPMLVRHVCQRGLGPHCEACAGVKSRRSSGTGSNDAEPRGRHRLCVAGHVAALEPHPRCVAGSIRVLPNIPVIKKISPTRIGKSICASW